VKRNVPYARMALAMALSVPLAAVLASGTAAASATSRAAAARHHGHLARPVYVPYFETWTTDSIPAVARASGARFLALAFLQTPKRGSCSVAWNGDRKQLVRPGGRYTGQIADSCTSVPRIVKAYESVVTTYHVTRLDMDVEARSLADQAGIARRSQALRLLQQWAARTHHRLQIIFTLGVEPWGLPANCFAVLKSAAAHGVRFTVNIMAFDYYIKASKTGLEMGTEALMALRGTHRQLARLYPGLSQRRLWAMEGITLLPGIDDYPKKTEVTYLSDARRIRDFARAHRLPLISIWAIQRDNGGCPGTIDSDTCSGIRQPAWAFSRLLESHPRR